jgi:hypothetical protein
MTINEQSIQQNNLANFKIFEDFSSSFILVMIIFRILLEICLYFFISPKFTYEFPVDLRFIKYSESWIIYLIWLMILPKKQTRPSDFLMSYLLIFFLAPLLVFYALTNAARLPIYLIFLTVITINIFRAGSPIKISFLKIKTSVMLCVSFFMVILTSFWFIICGGLNYFNLDIVRVYEFRDAISEKIDIGIMSYLNNYSYNLFGPSLLIFSLWKRKYFYTFLVSSIYLFWFGVSSQKSLIFIPFLLLGIWYCLKKNNPLFNLSILLVLIISSTLFIYLFSGNIIPLSLIVRRLFFMPSYICFKYFDFFKSNPFVFWSQSLMGKFINYPYGDISYPNLIGGFIGNKDSYANANFFATGYMHAGIFGMLIYGIILGLILRSIDSLTYKKIDTKIAITLTIIPFNIVFLSSDLLTTLLSHGLLMTILFLLVIGRNI